MPIEYELDDQTERRRRGEYVFCLYTDYSGERQRKEVFFITPEEKWRLLRALIRDLFGGPPDARANPY